jgi:hypothetical protein
MNEKKITIINLAIDMKIQIFPAGQVKIIELVVEEVLTNIDNTQR